MSSMKFVSSLNSCGPSATYTACRILRVPCSPELLKEIYGPKLFKEGTTPLELRRGHRKLGLVPEEHSWDEKADADAAWLWLRKTLRKGRPVILSVDKSLHWVLVTWASKDSALIRDPMLKTALKEYTRAQVLRRWWDGKQGGDGYLGISLSVKGRP
jgi:hypothetical protein